MGAFVRLYTFISQIIDYQNTAVEKRAIFYRYLIPLLEFGREREGVDLSKVVLTHHHLRDLGKRTLPLQVGEAPKLDPLKETGSGMLREPEKAWMAEIIAKLNEVFGEDTSNDDQLVYVNHVLMGKLMESETLRQQAANNSKEQFGTSPDLPKEVVNAAMDAQDAHLNMSNKLLNSPEVLKGVLEILLNHSKLWEALRGASAAPPAR
jgi:type I restriction enzyme, R subunit